MKKRKLLWKRSNRNNKQLKKRNNKIRQAVKIKMRGKIKSF